MVAVHRGDRGKAQQLIEAISFASGYHGAFDTRTGSDTTSDQYVGNAAWFLLALCHYAKRWGTTYAATANSIADWIMGFYSSGTISAGLKGNGTSIGMIVTEAQIDAIAALRSHAAYYSGSYGTAADTAENYMFQSLKNGNRFYAGITNGTPDTTFYVDTTLWAALMLPSGERFDAVVAAISDTDALQVTTNSSIGPRETGWKDSSSKNRIFVEAYAYFALLHSRLGNQQGYVSLLTSMRKFTASSATYGYGIVLHSNNPDWTGGDISLSSEATLWFLLAQLKVNPFRP